LSPTGRACFLANPLELKSPRLGKLWFSPSLPDRRSAIQFAEKLVLQRFCRGLNSLLKNSKADGPTALIRFAETITKDLCGTPEGVPLQN
jgi:hypothetical protein